VQNQYAALGVQVIGASADTLDDRARVLQFIRETRLNFPVWLGASAADMERFGLGSVLPGTVVIDRDGRIVAAIVGVVNSRELKKHIEALLAQGQKQPTEQARAIEKPNKASSVPS
ncbi:MAG: TlpA disulfide reductase family protein, partial [Blastocatellia bacterium]